MVSPNWAAASTNHTTGMGGSFLGWGTGFALLIIISHLLDMFGALPWPFFLVFGAALPYLLYFGL